MATGRREEEEEEEEEEENATEAERSAFLLRVLGRHYLLLAGHEL